MIELIDIEGVGNKTLELLGKLGIDSVNDLLHYYPFRYDILKRSDITNLSDNEKIIIDGVVEGQPTTIYLSNKLKKIIFRINAKVAILNVTIYNKTYLYQELKCGKERTIIGKYDKVKNTVVASDVRFDRLPPSPKIEPILGLYGEKDITVNKLASISCLTQSTVDSLVNGKSKNPKLLTIVRICDGLGITLSEFFDDEVFINIDRED